MRRSLRNQPVAARQDVAQNQQPAGGAELPAPAPARQQHRRQPPRQASQARQVGRRASAALVRVLSL